MASSCVPGVLLKPVAGPISPNGIESIELWFGFDGVAVGAKFRDTEAAADGYRWLTRIWEIDLESLPVDEATNKRALLASRKAAPWTSKEAACRLLSRTRLSP